MRIFPSSSMALRACPAVWKFEKLCFRTGVPLRVSCWIFSLDYKRLQSAIVWNQSSESLLAAFYVNIPNPKKLRTYIYIGLAVSTWFCGMYILDHTFNPFSHTFFMDNISQKLSGKNLKKKNTSSCKVILKTSQFFLKFNFVYTLIEIAKLNQKALGH